MICFQMFVDGWIAQEARRPQPLRSAEFEPSGLIYAVMHAVEEIRAGLPMTPLDYERLRGFCSERLAVTASEEGMLWTAPDGSQLVSNGAGVFKRLETHMAYSVDELAAHYLGE